MLGFLESPKRPKSDILGSIDEKDILKFSHIDCDNYLVNSHTKKELKKMKLKDKINLILELEYNFKSNSI